jgi:hypothetical protein
MRKPNNEKRRIDYYCDRCETAFANSHAGEKDPGDTSVQRGVTLTLPLLDALNLSFRTMDLCGKCVTALCRWLDSKRKGTKGK